MSDITVTPLQGKTFGCRLEGIRLGALDEAAFAVLAEAFLQYQVVVVADCHVGEVRMGQDHRRR